MQKWYLVSPSVPLILAVEATPRTGSTPNQDGCQDVWIPSMHATGLCYPTWEHAAKAITAFHAEKVARRFSEFAATVQREMDAADWIKANRPKEG